MLAAARRGATALLPHAASIAARCAAVGNAAAPVFRDPIVGVMSGSTRVGSVNTKLAAVAARQCEELGADTRVIDLRDYDLPVYSAVVEEAGFPETASSLKHALGGCDAWIIACPEYNGFITPLLLNALTWCSRGDPSGTPMYATFKGKRAVVMGASPGALGGMRAMAPHKDLLHNLGTVVLPNAVAVGGAFTAFDDEGGLVNDEQRGMLEVACQAIVEAARVEANRPATCNLVRTVMASHTVGEYGSVTVAGRGHA